MARRGWSDQPLGPEQGAGRGQQRQRGGEPAKAAVRSRVCIDVGEVAADLVVDRAELARGLGRERPPAAGLRDARPSPRGRSAPRPCGPGRRPTPSGVPNAIVSIGTPAPWPPRPPRRRPRDRVGSPSPIVGVPSLIRTIAAGRRLVRWSPSGTPSIAASAVADAVGGRRARADRRGCRWPSSSCARSVRRRRRRSRAVLLKRHEADLDARRQVLDERRAPGPRRRRAGSARRRSRSSTRTCRG